MVSSRHTYSILQIAGMIPHTEFLLADGSARVVDLLYDSRKIGDAARGLFFALAGRRDGHQFIAEVYRAGVRNFVVGAGRVAAGDYPGANFIVVADTLAALQALAARHRSRYRYPVIGITGSNGKTIVKEWLAQLMGREYRVLKSPKSYNSQIGVALSLWQLDDSHDLAIIEAGISRPGEMQALRRMIVPDIGVLTTIGPAHDDGFLSRGDKVREKLVLLDGVKTAVFSPVYLDGADVPEAEAVFTWGDGDCTLRLVGYAVNGGWTALRAAYRGQELEIRIPFTDAAARENALCCWAVLLAMGYGQQVIGQRMATLQPMEMRLEMKNGVNGCTIIDDSYSNDLYSLSIALEFLQQLRQHPGATLILSDIPAAAFNEEVVYNRVATLLKSSKVNRLLAVGDGLGRHRRLFDFVDLETFADTEAFLAALPGIVFQNEIVLIKGGRQFAFERISALLTAKSHDTVLEINLGAVEHNLNQYRQRLPKSVKLMAMVKAFSYGSGSYEVANLLQFNGVDYLTVAFADEGVELRQAGIRLPIMVMSPRQASLGVLVQYRLEPEIYGFGVLDECIRVLEARGMTDYPIHIKVDTGMHRLGFAVDDAGRLLDRLRRTRAVCVKSVFSHLSAAGKPEHDGFTRAQLERFGRFAGPLTDGLGYPVLRHIANTAGISRWPEAYLDMVRLGIGLYGVDDAAGSDFNLLKTSTLKTVISQIHEVDAGESVGYNRHGFSDHGRVIATVGIGYADGYDRRFGNGLGTMKIHGQLVYTVGDICMDMTMLDVTGLRVAEGDEVEVFGDVAALAESIGTIAYELLTGISQRVKRVYYY